MLVVVAVTTAPRTIADAAGGRASRHSSLRSRRSCRSPTSIFWFTRIRVISPRTLRSFRCCICGRSASRSSTTCSGLWLLMIFYRRTRAHRVHARARCRRRRIARRRRSAIRRAPRVHVLHAADTGRRAYGRRARGNRGAWRDSGRSVPRALLGRLATIRNDARYRIAGSFEFGVALSRLARGAACDRNRPSHFCRALPDDAHRSRLLGWGPLVLIGLISYSAYLWHWPVLAFYRYGYTEITPVAGSVIFVLTMVLAAITYRWVERPARRSTSSARRVLVQQYVLPGG